MNNRHESLATRVGAPLSFLDLAAETRNEIYDLALREPDHAVEIFWPGVSRQGAAALGEEEEEEEEEEKDPLRRSAASDYRGTTIAGFARRKTPALLGTCRWIHMEAASVFYGGNTWAFDDGDAWIVAYAWLLAIGPKNRGLIREITLPLPVPDDYSSAELMEVGALIQRCGFRHDRQEENRVVQQVTQAPLQIRGRDCIDQVCRMLGSAGMLSQLRLLIVENKCSDADAEETLAEGNRYFEELDSVRQRCRNLKLKLVIIHYVFDSVSAAPGPYEREINWESMRGKLKKALEKGWSIEYAAQIGLCHCREKREVMKASADITSHLKQGVTDFSYVRRFPQPWASADVQDASTATDGSP